MIGRCRIVSLLIAMAFAMAACRAQSPTEAPTTLTPGALSRAGTLTTIRAAHTATLLPSGRVFFTGGCTAQSCERSPLSSSTELYDPTTNAFSRGPQMSSDRVGGHMSTGRTAHVAVRLTDSKVLVIGGERTRGSVVATAELYEPRTGTFSPASEMSVVRYKHAAVTLADGRVLVIGGSDARDGFGRYDTAEIWDPRTRSFSAAGRMHSQRYKIPLSAVRLRDGSVLVAGGAPQAELFDPGSQMFAIVPGDMGASYAFSTATVLSSGDVLIAGGYDDAIRLTDRAFIFRPQ